jgi:endonuclease/exonuclease/phosphatase (EEP) superfamily protein YafD
MRVTIKGLLQVAAVLAVLFSTITLIPADNASLQLFTHFRLQYFAASVVLLVIFAALREPRYALALFLVSILNGSMVTPWYNGEPIRHDGTEIKVLLANVLSNNSDHIRLFDLLEVEKPDLVVFVEVSPQWEKALVQLNATYPHSVIESRAGNFGIALYSRLPLLTAAAVDSEPLGFPTIVADVSVAGRSLLVVATHPMIPLGASNYAARNKQLNGVARLLQRSDGPRILVGDLNATMWDLQYLSLENKTWLRNARRGFGVVPTWPTFMPVAMIPIDHVLVSEEFEVQNVRTGPRIGSDHLPLIVTVTL